MNELTFFLAFDPNKNPLDMSLATKEIDCRRRFAKYFLGGAELKMDIIDIDNVWRIYSKNGYCIREFKVQPPEIEKGFLIN